MERSKVHVLAPGDEGQVATTRSGEVVWDDVPAVAGLTAEDVRDIIGTALVSGTGITITVDDAADTLTVAYSGSGTGGLDAEQVRDAVAAFLVAGTGITVTHNDAGDVLTIAATGGGGGGLDAEAVRDVVAAMLTEGTGIDLTYNDAGDVLTIAATGGGGGGSSTLDGLTDVDTTTSPPTVGEALVWDQALGQWVPGLPTYPSPADVTPQVVAIETARFAAPPYTLDATTLGASNFDASGPVFEGQLVVIMEWRIGGPTGPSAPDAHWTSIAGDAAGFDGAVQMLVYVGDPTDTVTMPLSGTANGPAQMTVLAVADALPLLPAVDANVDVEFEGPGNYPQHAFLPFGGFPRTEGDVVVAVLHNEDDGVTYTPVTLNADPPFYDVGDLAYTATGTAPDFTSGVFVRTVGADQVDRQIRIDHDDAIGTSASNYFAGAAIRLQPIPGSGGTGGPIAPVSLDELTDVNTAGADVGEVLGYNGSGWVPVPASGGAALTAEEVRDTIGATLVAGTGITVTVDDAGDTVTLAATGGGSLDAETVRDLVGAVLVAGTGVTIVVDDAGDTVTVSSTVTPGHTLEELQDIIGGTLVAGANVSLTYDDPAGTVTIASTGSGLDAEGVRDLVGATLVAGTGITVTVDDVGDTVTIAATGGGGGLTAEEVRDTIAAALVAGTGVTVAVDDTADTITVSSTVTPGLTLEQIQDAVAAMLVEGTGVDLAYDDGAGTITVAATGGGGGGATTLDALTDVDTTGAEAPGDGYILTYDATTSQWIPRPGGGAVGSWENNETATFAHGTLAEAAQSFAVSGITMPPTPQHTLTVTEDMLASCDKEIGFAQFLIVVFLFDGSAMTGATASTLVGEATHGADVATANVSINTTTAARVTNTFVLRDAAVGDVITFRWRLNGAGHGNVTCTFRGAAAYPLLSFRAAPPGGGRWLYRDFVTGTMLPAPLQASQGIVPNLNSFRLYDNDATASGGTNSGPEGTRDTWVPGPNYGIFSSSSFHNLSNRLAASGTSAAAAAPWSATIPRCPATVRYDRLAIPALPV